MRNGLELLKSVSLATWWNERSALERVGVAAVGVGVVAVGAVALAPELAAAAVGGALTASGAWFLRRGVRS
jgi:hypothetical protein